MSQTDFIIGFRNNHQPLIIYDIYRTTLALRNILMRIQSQILVKCKKISKWISDAYSLNPRLNIVMTLVFCRLCGKVRFLWLFWIHQRGERLSFWTWFRIHIIVGKRWISEDRLKNRVKPGMTLKSIADFGRPDMLLKCEKYFPQLADKTGD